MILQTNKKKRKEKFLLFFITYFCQIKSRVSEFETFLTAFYFLRHLRRGRDSIASTIASGIPIC